MRLSRVVVCLVVLSSWVFASVPADVRRLQENILSQESQRQRALEEEMEDLRPPAAEEKSPDSDLNLESKKSLFVSSIVLEGSHLFTPEDLHALVAAYEGQFLSRADLNDILRTLTQHYVDHGYVTSRVYVPPQGLEGGRLRLKVLEGRIGKLQLQQGEEKPGALSGFAFPTSEQASLNLRDLEQGIDQITRLETYRAEMDLKPGEKAGESDVLIKTHQDFPVGVRTGGDNYGSTATGRRQGDVDLNFEDLLGLYEAVRLNYRRDLERKAAELYSKSLSVHMALPLGYSLLRYSGSTFAYGSTTFGHVQRFRFSGNMKSHRVELDRVVHRSGAGKTGLGVFISYKKSINYLETIRLKTSSQTLSTWGIRPYHTRRAWGGVLVLEALYTQGVSWMGALRTQQGQGPSIPNPHFKRWNVDASYGRPFKILTERFKWTTKIQAQRTPHVLFGSERLSLGGAQSVRGFHETNISGNQGVFVRNDLAYVLFDPEQEVLKRVMGEGSAFVGFDYGWIRKNKQDAFERGVLKSVCVGLKFQGGFGEGEVTFAKPLSRPGFLKKEGSQIHMRFGVKF